MNMPRSIQRHLALDLVLGLAVACSPPDYPEFGELQWAGERVDVWVEEPLEACGGSFAYLDGHAQHLADLAQAAAATSPAVPYPFYWVSHDVWSETGCGEGANGCARYGQGETIYSMLMPLVHELVHAEFGRMHSFFAEGLANTYGDDRTFSPTSDPETDRNSDIKAVIDGARKQNIDAKHYGIASIFSRHLIDKYGPRVIAIMQETSRSMRYADIAAVFGRHDIELDAEVDEIENNPVCGNAGIRIALSECALPPTPWQTDELWVTSGTLECDSSEVLGATDGEIWTLRSFEIAAGTAGDYAMFVDAPLARLSKCDKRLCESSTASGAEPSVLMAGGRWHEMVLDAGRYWVRVEQSSVAAPVGTFELRLKKSVPQMCPPEPEPCIFGTDECGFGRFACDEMCLPELWLCDGTADCPSGDDEVAENCDDD